MKNNSPGLTVIILAKNEEKNLPYVFDQLKNFSGEILLVDGSTHRLRTEKITEKYHIRIIHDQGCGKGTAMRLGAKTAQGNILIFMDADGSHNSKDIPALVNPIINNQADYVIGSRALGGSDESHGTFYRFIRESGSHLITVIINHRFNTNFSDSQNGFRAIKKSVFHQLNIQESCFAVEQEMLIKALRQRFKVIEVPTHEYARRFGKSQIIIRKFWFHYLYTLVKNLYF
ncbi:MAG: glycosyltransferase family 2 protein [Candidatus Gottesmanbacteria bacterium]